MSRPDARLLRRSRVTDDGTGWTWLEPERGSSVLRFALASILLSVLLVTAAAAATLPPPVFAVPLLAAVLGVAGFVGARSWRGAHERVGVSGLGVLVQSGARVVQLGWPAIAAVRGVPAGTRLRILVATREQDHVTATGFDPVPARQWLERCTAEARRRRLDPQPAVDGLGFTTGG